MTSNQGFMYSVLLGINTAVPNQYLKLTKIDYDETNKIMFKKDKPIIIEKKTTNLII